MASPLQLETPEEKRRRIEQEKLQGQMENIGFESVDTPVPVETTELPVETTELPAETTDPVQLSEFIDLPEDKEDIDFSNEELEIMASLNNSELNPLMSLMAAQAGENIIQSKDTYWNNSEKEYIEEGMDDEVRFQLNRINNALQQAQEDTEKTYSYTDLKEGRGPKNSDGEDFPTVAERWLREEGEDEDIAETLRDSSWSLGDTLALGFDSKNWSTQHKKDYAYLRPTFENAEIREPREQLEAFKDIFIDIFTDPPNWVAAYLTIKSGGVAAIPISAAARLATNQALKQGLTKVAQNGTFRAVSIGMTEGSIDAGGINYGTQLANVNIGEQDEIDPEEVKTAIKFGAEAGGLFGGTIYKAANYYLRRKTQKIIDDLEIENDIGPPTEEKFQELNRARILLDKITANTSGKPTAKFIEVAKESKSLKQFLLNFAPRSLQRIFSKEARTEVIDKPLRSTDEAGDMGYANDSEASSAAYTTFINESLQTIQDTFKRVRDTDGSWFNLRVRLTENDNKSLAYLLTKGDLLDDYIIVTPKDPNKPFINLNIKKSNNEISEEIEALQEKYGLKFTEEMYEGAAKIRYFFKQIREDANNVMQIQPDGSKIKKPLLAEDQQIPNYFHRVLNYAAITATPESLEIFRQMLVRSGHADPNDFKPKRKVTLDDEVPPRTGTGGAERKGQPDYDKAPEYDGTDVADETIDKEYFKDLDSPYFEGESILYRYDSFIDLAKYVIKTENNALDATDETLLKLGYDYDAVLQKAKELKADALLQDLHNKKYLSKTVRDSSGGKSEFLRERVWGKLNDEELIANGFVNINMLPLLSDYAQAMGRKINEQKYFGLGNNFESVYIKPIRDELLKSKKFSDDEVIEILEGLRSLKNSVVGDPAAHMQLNSRIKTGFDFVRTTQAMAHLTGATLSSITEPFIILARSDLPDTPAGVKAFKNALGLQIKKNWGKNGRLWEQMKLATGREINSFKDLTDPEFLEVQRLGIAVENAMIDRIDGMFSENIQNTTLKNLNTMFFNSILLSQWTQAVQMGAFNYAKERTTRITAELASGRTKWGNIKLSKTAIQRRREQLHEIGIDANDAINTYNSSFVAGKFNVKQWQDSAFFDTQVVPGAQSFSKEIILNPSASNANKPLWFGNPVSQVLIQFANYPIVFSNTVLKQMARDTIRYPAANAPRTAAAMTMMTGVAMIGNNIRSRGESGNKTIEQQIIDGFDRTGLAGQASYLYRGYKNASIGGGGFVPIITKTFGGPFVSDVADGIAYNTDPITWLSQNMPGYSLMAPDSRRALNTFTKRYWASKTGDTPDIVRKIKSKGGVVEDVLNVISEPDERKVRGQPNTYSGMAGVLFQDEEERGAFAKGGKVSITDTDEMYGYLTKDEDEYNVILDKNPISIYSEETLPDLDIKDTYYTGFKGKTVSDKLNSVRQSTTIGLPVTKNKKKAKGVMRVAGKIKFKNVLKLNIDRATPDLVQAELNKNMDSLIKIEDKILGKEIIKAANDNLAIRDAVLNKDPARTLEKEAVIAKNKSFLVRHQLLKLGYDAIETKEGYTLLRENQFLPTEIMERTKAYGGGMASALNRRQQYFLGSLASSLKQRFKNKIPLQYRTFIDKIFIKNTDNFTEKDMTSDELKLYKKEIKQKIREGIKNGELFINSEGKLKAIRNRDTNDNQGFFPSINWTNRPLFETFGTSGLDINPANQNVKLIDTYDFKFVEDYTGPQTGTGGFTKENLMEYVKQLGFTKEDIKGVISQVQSGYYDKLNKHKEKMLKENPDIIIGTAPKNPRISQRAVPFAERYGAYTLPDKETAANINKERIKEGLPAQEFPEIKMNVNTTLDFDPEEWKSLMEQAQNNNLNRRQQYNEGGEPLTLEQKQKRYDLNKKYLEEIHNYSIANKATGLDDEGKTISMATSSLGTAADKHYIINKWNPYTKKLEDDSFVLKRIESLVKEGKLLPYSTPKEAEEDRAKIRNEILNRRQQYGLGGRIASKLAQRLSRKVMPAPQRFLDKEDKAYKPFLKDFEFTEGGRYIELDGKSPKKDITGEYPKQASISVDSTGRAELSISKEIFTKPPEPSGKIIRTNLFKKEKGWKWLVAPKGFDPNPNGKFPIVSTETGNKHYYSLSTDFPEGVQLNRYDKKKTEPRLRPTTKGNLKFGNIVGKISVRGREHPVYDNLTVESLLDNKQQFNKGGLVRKIIMEEND